MTQPRIDISELQWLKDTDLIETWNGVIDGRLIAWIIKRPAYCDRGHWQANIELPIGLDHADGFPRYYMQFATAKKEIELFLNWRINKIRGE